MKLCAGLELLKCGEKISTASPVLSLGGQDAEAKWFDLKLNYAVNTGTYD